MCSKCYASIKPNEEDVSITSKSSGDDSIAQKATTEKDALESKVVEETKNKSETINISKAVVEKSDAAAATSNDEKGSDENKQTADTATTTDKAGVVSTTDVKSPAKKKKKKATYKNLMAGMLEKSKDRDIDKESEKAIKKVTGGGTFTKIDKI